MAVLDIDIAHHDREHREAAPDRNVHFADLYGSIELFVGFANELVNDPVLEKEYRQCNRKDQNTTSQAGVQEYFPEDFQ
jgi:hypothetical protein